jgi:hypothetical protein
MGCKGLHCDGCGGGGGLAVVLIVLAVIAAGAWHVRHGIETGLEIVFWSIVGCVGLAVAGGLVYGAVRWRARVRDRQARTVIPARAEVVRLGDGQDRARAIEAPRPASWPLPGQWDEIRPRIGRDS